MLNNTGNRLTKLPFISRKCIMALKNKKIKKKKEGWEEKGRRKLKMCSSLIRNRINFFLSHEMSLPDLLPGGHKKRSATGTARTAKAFIEEAGCFMCHQEFRDPRTRVHRAREVVLMTVAVYG